MINVLKDSKYAMGNKEYLSSSGELRKVSKKKGHVMCNLKYSIGRPSSCQSSWKTIRIQKCSVLNMGMSSQNIFRAQEDQQEPATHEILYLEILNVEGFEYLDFSSEEKIGFLAPQDLVNIFSSKSRLSVLWGKT